MKELRLPLKRKWFEMTEAGIKTEDYREITRYWLIRLFKYHDPEILDECQIGEVLYELNNRSYTVDELKRWAGWEPKNFNFNVMTLGYPSKNDKGRILTLEHKGIEIRTGNPDWGAEPGKIYFVIKHGKIL